VGILGEKDRPGAGAPDGFLPAKAAQRLDELEIEGQLADGGGFAARDDQPIQVLELLGQPYLHRLRPDLAQHEDMFFEITLKG
jgi:hypothetical protein